MSRNGRETRGSGQAEQPRGVPVISEEESAQCGRSGSDSHSTRGRFLRFQAVGVIGVGVHLGVLQLAVGWGHFHYLAGTVLAVEAALLHNFAWHLSWTWAGRPSSGPRDLLARMVRFHCANGLVSVVGNSILMGWFVGRLGLPALAGGSLSIAICSVVNFLLGDRFVFRQRPAS